MSAVDAFSVVGLMVLCFVAGLNAMSAAMATAFKVWPAALVNLAFLVAIGGFVFYRTPIVLDGIR